MDGRIKTAHDITERLRTDDVFNDENSNVDFASLLLSGPVLEGLQGAGFQRPSPIQLKAIPLGRCGLDLVIQAKSGTGKTCVFSVIALESVDLSSSATQVLILAPTREIAVQIQQVILDIGRMMRSLRCHVFIGGTLIGPDKQNLKKCHIAVGTPGRLKQLIETGVLVPDSIRLFILDEADKLLDDKFQSQINWIYNELPYNKQMLAASATYPEYLAQHLTTYMRDATFVRLNPKEIALHGIRQYYKLVEGHELPHKAFAVKVDELIALLSNVTFQQCLVFSNLHTRAENLCDILCQRGWQSVFMSGGLEQKQRLHAMSTFKKFECRVLISTDLTARGIDAEKVNLVINLDVPVDVKTYMHRIGRAGRFGTYGAAITLASFGREEILLHSIQKESHVPIRLLPDSVPSDLLSPSAEVSREPLISKDFMSVSKDDYHDDKQTVDNRQYTSKSRQSRLSTSVLSEQPGDSLTVSCVNEETPLQDLTESANLCFSMAPVKKPIMVDKGCQVDDPNSFLNVITSEIPSLRETLDTRRCYPLWSFAAALEDFKHLKKTGNFESNIDNKVLGNFVIEDANHDSKTFSQNKHMQSEKDIQRTVSPPDEDKEKKKENEMEEFHLPDSNDSMNRVVEEKIENDIPHNLIFKGTIDGGTKDEQRAEGIRNISTEDRLLIRNIIDRCEEKLSCENEEVIDSYATGNLQFQDEQKDSISSVTKDCLGKRKADRSCDQRMGTLNEICNSKSDPKMYEESHRNNRKIKSDTIVRNEDKAITVRHKQNIMKYLEVEQFRTSPNTTSSKVLWTEEEDYEEEEKEEEEEEEQEEEEQEEESYDETGSSIVESSNESITTENTSSSNDSEGESDTSQTDEEEDSASNIYMIKDGVVVQVSSKKQGSSRKTVYKEVENSLEYIENNSHSKEVPEMEETTVLDGRRDVERRRRRCNRKETHQQSRTSNELYNNNPYYDCSGSYHCYGTVPGYHHQMSQMGYHAGPSYQDFGCSGLQSWPYVWQVPYWPTYPAGIAGSYHQHPVAGNQGPEGFPYGQSNVRQPRSQDYEQKY